jgi:hypothetical protein
MSRDADQSPAGGLKPPVELECEKQVGELGLRVGSPARVATLTLQVVEPHLPTFVAVAADGHNPGVGPFKEWQQEASQREMAEMVGPELKLKAVGRLSVGCRHHAGVVDEQIDVIVSGSNAISEGAYRTKVGKVELYKLN